MKVFIFLLAAVFVCASAAFAADPSPSPQSSGISYAKTSEKTSTDDMTYDKKMKYRKEREEYNKLVKDYNEMMQKKAAESAAVGAASSAVDEDTPENFAKKRMEEKKKAKTKRRVLVG
jgi:hypothetical protein